MQLGATISLADAIALGVSAAPIGADQPLSDAELTALRQEYAAAGITPVQTNGYCNLVATDEAVRLENIAATRELLRKADLAGSRAVVVGGGHRDPAVPREVFRRIRTTGSRRRWSCSPKAAGRSSRGWR